MHCIARIAVTNQIPPLPQHWLQNLFLEWLNKYICYVPTCLFVLVKKGRGNRCHRDIIFPRSYFAFKRTHPLIADFYELTSNRASNDTEPLKDFPPLSPSLQSASLANGVVAVEEEEGRAEQEAKLQ